jgi:ribonuclease P protein component
VGNAVQRNRAKRLMRELVRLNQEKLPNNIYLVMVARKSILSTAFTILNDSFLNFISKFVTQYNEV